MQFNETVLEHFNNPRNPGAMEDPDAIGEAGREGRGNFIRIFAKVSRGKIRAAKFQTFGCPGAIACGSVATELLIGKPIDEALAITQETILRAVGDLPLGRRHCAGLAAEAIRNCLEHIGSS